ncbi:DUF1254 domain-containing protein [Gordonia sp. NPDC003424]
MDGSSRRVRVGRPALLQIATAVIMLLSAPCAGASPALGFAPSTTASPLTDPSQIEKLTSLAYTWGLPAEFVYRFGRFNYLATAPRNQLGGFGTAAAWNNNGTNAGDASVIYLNAMLDLSGENQRGGTKELVLTVPPSWKNYYVVNVLDSFVNSIGSIGTRTTPGVAPQTYLLAGPTSKYAHQRVALINGYPYRVLTSDTNLNWVLIRIRADMLVPPSSSASGFQIENTVVQRFALTSLRAFEANNHRPTYFRPNQYTPTPSQLQQAQFWHNAPSSALQFFEQMGVSLNQNPLPTARTGLHGSPLQLLPPWVVPQYGAKNVFLNPSYGQRRTLALFRPLGLTEHGFKVPSNWGPSQLQTLQNGYVNGQAAVRSRLLSTNVTAATNYWSYLNDKIGTYPNTPDGYLLRAGIVLAGGSANVPLDAVYAQINSVGGTDTAQLDGNNTYKLTFTPPRARSSGVPIVGTLPPTVNDLAGNPRAFWSIHAYQLDTSESGAPFITQASVLNTAYSQANSDVIAVDPRSNTITVKRTAWSPLTASTPIIFGSTAAKYGLKPNTPYFVANTPKINVDAKTRTQTYTFGVSAIWRQELSPNNVPIQGTTGTAGPTLPLVNPGGRIALKWGPVQPVSQLGSQQLSSGRLAKNPDGSVTIWIGPTLPPGAPATNWLPTPSSAYYATAYPGVQVPTSIRPMIRIYYPTPGSNTEASILPPPDGSMLSTYVFPALQKVGRPNAQRPGQ